MSWITAAHLVITALGKESTPMQRTSGIIQQGVSSIQDFHSQEEQVESKDARDIFLKKDLFILCVCLSPETHELAGAGGD